MGFWADKPALCEQKRKESRRIPLYIPTSIWKKVIQINYSEFLVIV